MGRMSQNPKAKVFTFRAPDDIAELIYKAAAAYPDVSAFLLEAAASKALNDSSSKTIHPVPRGGK